VRRKRLKRWEKKKTLLAQKQNEGTSVHRGKVRKKRTHQAEKGERGGYQKDPIGRKVKAKGKDEEKNTPTWGPQSGKKESKPTFLREVEHGKRVGSVSGGRKQTGKKRPTTQQERERIPIKRLRKNVG